MNNAIKCAMWKCNNDAVVSRIQELHTEYPGSEIYWLNYCEFHKNLYPFDGLEIKINNNLKEC
jgi:hypothetical protein